MIRRTGGDGVRSLKNTGADRHAGHDGEETSNFATVGARATVQGRSWT